MGESMPTNKTEEPEAVECAVVYTALGKVQWEASCPCGFWVRGTKRECEAAANGHRTPAQ